MNIQDTIVIATGNPYKIEEIRFLLKYLPLKVLSLQDIGISVEPEENGDTFQANALIKAREIAKHTTYPVIADDSGLSVDFLRGNPGVHSKRFSGPKATDVENNFHLLKKMEGVPPEQRTAHFVCAVAIVWPGGEEQVVEGRCDGMILSEFRGEGGFGYDSVFYVPDLRKTFAQLTLEEKNTVSHRAIAFGKLKKLLCEGR